MSDTQSQFSAAVFDEVKSVVAEVFGVPAQDLMADTRFVEDLDESLEIVETMMACENAFGLEIPNGEAERFETVATLAAYIEARLWDRAAQQNSGVWPPPPQVP